MTQLLWIGDAHDEQNKKAITRLHEILKRRPENRQWIQQDKERVMEFKTKLMKIAYIIPKHDVFLQPPEKVHPFSIAGRLINDSDNRELNSAWERLMCIDDQFREFSQPFYATNPETGLKECTETTDDLWDWIDKEGLAPKIRPLTTTEIGNHKLTI